MNMINMLTPLKEDESITACNFRNCFPCNTSDLENSEEIRIPCHNSPFSHLTKSCLYIVRSLKDGGPVTLNVIKLPKNFPSFQFLVARLKINGQVVDAIRSPGLATTMENICFQARWEIMLSIFPDRKCYEIW